MKSENLPITASPVAQAQRFDFLPTYFGPALARRGEMLSYGWLRRLCSGYTGGHWNFYTLSNGGFYMAPDLSGKLEMVVAGNQFWGELSADAAGIVAIFFTLGQMAAECEGKDAGDALTRHYQSLLDFVADHPEAALFRSAIN